MAVDVLNSLRAQYETHAAIAKTAMENMEAIKVAIAAIEGRIPQAAPSTAESEAPVQKPRRRRGEVQRAILECLREGHATPRQIRAVCAARGLSVPGNSVSNCLNRLLQKGLVRGIPHTDRWELKEASDLKKALEDSIKAEGSRVVALKPSQVNGAVNQYTPAASEGPYS
jgi:hypothetical protein